MGKIEDLKAKLDEAIALEKDANKHKLAVSFELVAALCEHDGIRVGQTVEHKRGDKICRGKIIRFGLPRWAVGDSYTVYVQAIKKDGSTGDRVTELSRGSFFPRDENVWPKKAWIIAQPEGEPS